MSIPPLPPPSWSSEAAPDSKWLAEADREALREAVLRLSARVSALEWEKAALTFAAESFGALAERLNVALRAIRESPRL